MPICDIWCYTLQDSHNKLEACRVLMGKVESSDVYFLAAYILSSLQSFLQPLIFRFRIHARTSYNNDETCQPKSSYLSIPLIPFFFLFERQTIPHFASQFFEEKRHSSKLGDSWKQKRIWIHF